MAFYPFIGLSHKDRLYWARFLAETAEDTPGGIQLVGEWVSSPFLIFGGLDVDALRRTDDHAEAAGDTLGLPTLILLKILNAPPTFRRRNFLFRILDGDGLGEKSAQRKS